MVVNKSMLLSKTKHTIFAFTVFLILGSLIQNKSFAIDCSSVPGYPDYVFCATTYDINTHVPYPGATCPNPISEKCVIEIAKATLCSTLPGYGDYVFCVTTASADQTPYPSGAICSSIDFKCVIVTNYLCEANVCNDGSHCVLDSPLPCSGGVPCNTKLVCPTGSHCCPKDKVTLACTTLAYNSCELSSEGCDDMIQTYTPLYSCTDPNYICCITNCYPGPAQGGTYECLTSPPPTGYSLVPNMYCSSGSCYQNLTTGTDCYIIDGHCEAGPTTCDSGDPVTGDTWCPTQLDGPLCCSGSGIIDLCDYCTESELACTGTGGTLIQGDCSQEVGFPICCAQNFVPTCVSPNVCKDVTIEKCPTYWTVDASKTCDPKGDKQCCTEPATCTIDPTCGRIANTVTGGYFCASCGGDCKTEQRCVQLSASSTPICVACLASLSCTKPGECGTAAGCIDGFMCIYSKTALGNICVPNVACGGDGIITAPYTGPIIDITQLLDSIYQILYPVGIFIGVFVIAKAGYTLMTSEGNPQKIKEGQEELTAAILGTFFILGGLAVLRAILKAMLGIDI